MWAYGLKFFFNILSMTDFASIGCYKCVWVVKSKLYFGLKFSLKI